MAVDNPTCPVTHSKYKETGAHEPKRHWCIEHLRACLNGAMQVNVVQQSPTHEPGPTFTIPTTVSCADLMQIDEYEHEPCIRAGCWIWLLLVICDRGCKLVHQLSEHVMIDPLMIPSHVRKRCSESSCLHAGLTCSSIFFRRLQAKPKQ